MNEDENPNSKIKVTITYEGSPYVVDDAIHGATRRRGELQTELEFCSEELQAVNVAWADAKHALDVQDKEFARLRDANTQLENEDRRLRNDARMLREDVDRISLGLERSRRELSEAKATIDSLKNTGEPMFANQYDCRILPMLTLYQLKILIKSLANTGFEYGADTPEHPKYKIPMIKLIREATGWGLKESKEFVEWALDS